MPDMLKIPMNEMHGENAAKTFQIAGKHAILIHAITEVFVHHEYSPTNGKEEKRNEYCIQDFCPIRSFCSINIC